MTSDLLEAPLEQVQAAFPALAWAPFPIKSATAWELRAPLGASLTLCVEGLSARRFGTRRLHQVTELYLTGDVPTGLYGPFQVSSFTIEGLRSTLEELRSSLRADVARHRAELPQCLRALAATATVIAPSPDPVEDLVDDWALLASDDRTAWTLCATSALLSTLQREPHMRPLEILRGCTWAEAKAIKVLWIEESCDASQEPAP
jgi:hypothetical protein